MKCLMVRACALALFGFSVVAVGRSQEAPSAPPRDFPVSEQSPQPPTPAKPTAAELKEREEVNAYNKFVADSKTADAKQKISTGEAFVNQYPNSVYAGAVHAELAGAYLGVNNVDKMIESGEKALAANPNDIDVLPLMAWAMPRRINGNTPNAIQQLEKAVNYARRAINLLSTMPKPLELDDATFAKIKNSKLVQCHSGIGTAYVQTGKYDDAILELTLAVRLETNPDPVHYYLLGLANDRTSHFTDAIAAFDKCATAGPMVAQCRALSSETKKKAQNSLEAPR